MIIWPKPKNHVRIQATIGFASGLEILAINHLQKKGLPVSGEPPFARVKRDEFCRWAGLRQAYFPFLGRWGVFPPSILWDCPSSTWRNLLAGVQIGGMFLWDWRHRQRNQLEL